MHVGDVVAGRFELRELAGKGGTAAVYRARDLESERTVALKLIKDSEHNERFLREARLLAGLRHPAIVRYLDHGTVPEGGLYLAMEWLEGETLSRRLRRGKLSATEAVGLVMRIADALALAHQKGIVHRDIKPGNVLLVEAEVERAKLLDFGVARVFDPDGFVTLTGAVLGTPGYMAPEQARGEPDVDSRADVFALGCLLYHGLTGRAAFAAKAPLAVLAKLILEEPARVRQLRPGLPRELDDLVARMLAKDREQRPRDGAAVVRELRGFDLDEDAQPTRASVRPGVAITDSEQRVVCAILARGVFPADDEYDSSQVSTMAIGASTNLSRRNTDELEQDRALSALRDAATGAGARLDPLRDGSVIVSLTGAGSAKDQATSAARTALLVQHLFPHAPIAVATGSAVVSGDLPLGKVIDRAVALLEDTAAGQILIGPATAGLLDARFEVSPDAKGRPELRSERAGAETARLLLGKPTATVGRDREIAFLLGLLDDCIAEPMACAALLTGAAGVGKSRLRWELMRRLPEFAPGTRIWLARAEPTSQDSPFALLGQLLRRIIHVRDGEPTPRARQRLRDHVARTLPPGDVDRVFEFLGEVAGLPAEGQDEALAAAHGDPILMSDQMQRAWQDFVVGECRSGPVLLVLEDLHWGDRPSVKLVDAALRAAEDSPFMVLALARPDVHERFPRLWGQREVKTLTLGGLTRRSMRKLALEALGSSVGEATLDTIVDRADGNAFFLEELIRAVSEGDTARLPDSVLAMLQTRLEALPDGARRVLRAASVFGKVFWQEPVALLLGEGGNGAELGEWIDLLIERELVSERPGSRFHGQRELSFRHGLVADAAYGMLTPDDRERAHHSAAEWLEASGEPDVLALAAHHELGGNVERALGYWQEGAQKAIDSNDLATALDAVARARKLLPNDGAAAGSLVRIEAEAHLWRGDHDEARRTGELAFASLPEQSDDWYRAVFVLVTACQKAGDPERATEIARMLLDSSAWEEPAAPLLVTGSRAVIVLTQAGRFEIADRLFERLQRIAGPLTQHDASTLALWLTTKAMRSLYRGETEQYLCWSMLAGQTFERVGDLRNSAIQRHNGGHAETELGAYEDAERHLREAHAMAEQLGLRNVIAGARNNLGYALTRLGRFSEARPLLIDAERMLEEHGDQRMRGGALNHLAELELLEGNLDSAERAARRAVSMLEPYPPVRIHAIATLANVLLAQHRAREALDVTESGVEQLDALGGRADGELALLLAHARALGGSGLDDKAGRVLQRARARVEKRASEIEDPELRRRFLERVPEHARIVELAPG